MLVSKSVTKPQILHLLLHQSHSYKSMFELETCCIEITNAYMYLDQEKTSMENFFHEN